MVQEFLVNYICFVESDLSSVPHMHPLTSEDLEAAEAEAGRLLAMHSSGVAAHIFCGEERLATVKAAHRKASV